MSLSMVFFFILLFTFIHNKNYPDCFHSENAQYYCDPQKFFANFNRMKHYHKNYIIFNWIMVIKILMCFRLCAE